MKLVSNSQKSIFDSEKSASQRTARISSLVDGELTPEEIGAQIPQLLTDEGERERWRNYHLIRDMLQQQLPREHNPDFVRQVMAKLEAEPTVLVPANKIGSGKERPIFQKMMRLGLAASVAAVALLSSYTLNLSTDTQPIQMAASTQTTQTGPDQIDLAQTDLAQKDQAPKDQDSIEQWRRAPDLEQYSAYLVNHVAYSSGSRTQGFMPYARVVGYSNER